MVKIIALKDIAMNYNHQLTNINTNINKNVFIIVNIII